MAKTQYGRTLSPATRYGPDDKKAAVNLLIAEYARQQNPNNYGLSSSPTFSAKQAGPRGGYGSVGPLTSDQDQVWGNDLLVSSLGGSMKRKAFEDGMAMDQYLNDAEIAAMKKQMQTDENYRQSLQPKQSSSGGLLSKLIGGAKIAVGLSTGNYGLAISGGADVVS